MPEREHDIAVIVGGVAVRGWTEGEVQSDLLVESDVFTLTTFDTSEPALALLRKDAEVEIQIDGVTVLTGYVEDRRGGWRTLTISGKDYVGRMVAESADVSRQYGGRGIRDEAAVLAGRWFDSVALSNDANRDSLLGAGGRATSSPSSIPNVETTQRRMEPGTTKMGALNDLLDRNGARAWSSADGQTLIIARPNFDQAPQFTFFDTRAASNCLAIEFADSNAPRFASILAVGSGRGTSENFGRNVIARRGIARDNPDSFDGTGRNFLQPKLMIMPVDASSSEECQRLAEREQAEREAQAFAVSVRTYDWGQRFDGARERSLYAPDTIVAAFAEDTPVDGIFYCIARSFQFGREVESAALTLVNIGVGF